jgi:hypothetical protein
VKNTKTRLGFGRRIKQGVATLLATAGLVVGVNIATASPAVAVETTCPDWYHCAVTFDKNETKWMASKGVPMNYPNQFALLAATLLYYGHKPFLDVYASRDMCTKVTVSLVPWETQGFAGYNC